MDEFCLLMLILIKYLRYMLSDMRWRLGQNKYIRYTAAELILTNYQRNEIQHIFR